MNRVFCELVGLVAAYLDKHPDGAGRLRDFLTADKVLLDTADVIALTGWGRSYISQLCTSGMLPYIPGRPHKFMYGPLLSALAKMQTGGDYGRRKAKRRRA